MQVQVLLLGGHGKVALHLTPLLLARSWNVTSVIRNPDHEPEIRALANHPDAKGNLNVLVSSLDDVKSEADAARILDVSRPDYVVWSAGAGGKGGPNRTHAIDEVAAKAFISASFANPRVTRFLLVPWLGSRRNKPSWLSGEERAFSQDVFYRVLPAYSKAKLEADEFLVANAVRREREGRAVQAICLRPGTLTDGRATGRVDLGKTAVARGWVTREDVARVADALLARGDTGGWYDLLNGEEEVGDAVERVVREKVDAVEGEDVDAMVKRFGLDG